PGCARTPCGWWSSSARPPRTPTAPTCGWDRRNPMSTEPTAGSPERNERNRQGEVMEQLSREDRTALLAVARREELIGLADACLADGEPPRVLRAPEVGCVATQVVEPIAGERFLLGDVLAVRAEVELGGARG